MRRGSVIEGIGGRPADGDTFVLQTEQGNWDIRIYGIDAPEWGQKWFDFARDELKKLIHRKQVKCTVINKDCYGRFVCQCALEDGRDLAIELLAAGAAWYYSPRAIEREYHEVAIEALTKGLGIFSGGSQEPPYKYRARKQLKDSRSK